MKRHWKEDFVLIVKSQINTLYQDMWYCCFLVLRAEILLSFLFFFFPSAFDCGSSGAQCCSLCSKGSFQLHIVMAGADVDCFDLQQVQGRTPYLGWCCRHSINALGRQQQLKATSLHAFGCQRMFLSWDRLRCPAATIPPVSCVYSSKGVCVFTSALPGPGCWL